VQKWYVFSSLRSPALLITALLLSLSLPDSACAYSRVVSLSPQITESLFLLDAGNLLIADTTFCKRPEAAAAKEKIGSPARPDIEKIVSLKPDLVLASREGNSPGS